MKHLNGVFWMRRRPPDCSISRATVQSAACARACTTRCRRRPSMRWWLSCRTSSVGMADDRDLEQVRAAIDAIDGEIQSLINQRARCAQRVAEIKLADLQTARERGEVDTTAEVSYY